MITVKEDMLKKISAYLRAVQITRSCNLLGLPVIPKKLWKEVPSTRLGYNTFIAWLGELNIPSIEWSVDVGANHGIFSQAVSTLYPQSHALLVEPQQTLRPGLEYLAGKHPYWNIETSALGSTAGSAKMFVAPSMDATASLLGFSKDYLDNVCIQGDVREVECKVTTLDTCVEKYNIPRIDLLKIDVEGFEFEVLAGAQKSLKLVQGLVIEISLIRETPSMEHPLAKLIQILHENGLSIISIIPSLYSSQNPECPIEFNILAKRVS